MSNTKVLHNTPSIWGVVLSGFTAFLNLYLSQPFLTELSHDFNVSLSTIALSQSLTLLMLAISSPFVSACNDIYGEKTMLTISFLGLIICQIVTSLLNKFWEFAFVQSLLGFFVPSIIAAAATAASNQGSHRSSLRGSRIYVISIASGGMASRLLSGIMADAFGTWRASYIFTGVVTFVSFLVIMSLRSCLGEFTESASHHIRKVSLKKKFSHIIYELRDHLTNTKLLHVYFAGFLLLFSIISIYTVGVLRLGGHPFYSSTTERGLLFMANPIGCILASRVMIIMSHLTYGFWYFSVGFMFLGTITCLLPSKFFVFLGTFLVIMGAFGIQISSLSAVRTRANKAHSSAVGLYTTSYYMGGFLGNYGMAYLFESKGIIYCTVMLLVIISLLATMPVKICSRELQ
ncbi:MULTISPECIES: MFS transporter [Candidatus Ichthyocystis]|uniref:MFS transporter n=1 Tax=Candidatus Ichthyocystis TaxID=2929841 RepID=UPI000B8A2357|nr:MULTISPECIES: MFS transporter [Ichthyocystis]